MSEVTKDVKTDVEENDVVIDEDTIKEIGKQVAPSIVEAVKGELSDVVKEAQEDILSKYLEKTEKTVKKDVSDGDSIDKAAGTENDVKNAAFAELAKESPQMRFYKAARAMSRGNLMELQKYNDYAMSLRIAETKDLKNKANYGNETTAADGQVLVPDPYFDTTVYENLPKYGVAFREATIRTTDRNQVYALSLDSGLSFYATAEAGVKTGAKLSFSRKLTALQKYAVIVPATDELTDDAAIDFWALVTQELSRAYAKVADEITFTDTTYGITNTTGVITEATSGAGTTVDWGDLLDAEKKTEDDLDTSNFKWYMRKETWYRLIQVKGSTNDHYITGSLSTGWVPNPNQATTPWGTPVVFVRVLPTSGASLGSPGVVGSNDAFAVYGDLKNYLLYQKNGMEITMLREGTVKDAGGSDFNLATQDGTAMRAVIRLLGMLPKGNASKFVILGTGTVS